MPTKKSVLIIEDEQSLRKALVERLTNEKFTVYDALDGEDGLLKAHEHHPDLILLDILMPKLNGFQVLERLRLDPWGKTVPVVMLSNLNESVNQTKAQGHGVVEFLVKSNTTLDEIVEKLRSHLA
jgi:CheY-like chemotaxis protein